MDASTINGIQSLELNGSDAAAIPESRKFRCARICVEGYDTSLPRDDVKAALRTHFASCGEIAHVSIRRYADESDPCKATLNRYAMIYILGEGAEEKALELNGSDVGGWTVVAIAASFPKFTSDDELAAIRAEDRYEGNCGVKINVEGFDMLLPVDDLKSVLRKHFSSCGEIAHFVIHHSPETDEFKATLSSRAYMYILGEGAKEKALQLSGMDVGGWTVKAFVATYLLSEDEMAANRARSRQLATRFRVMVKGYDTSLPEDVIKSALTGHFASCGEISDVYISDSYAVVGIMGEDAKEKALALNGSDMGGCKLVAEAAFRPDKNKKPRIRTYGCVPFVLKEREAKLARMLLKEREAKLARILKDPNTINKYLPRTMQPSGCFY